jgi:lipoate-protein ligase A
MQWRYLDTGFHSGEFNMRVDERLAREVISGSGIPTLRFYQWNPYCISLGMHQALADIDTAKCRHEGVDVVRRPTGGRAILHAEELTYSVVFPESMAGSLDATYRQISEALAAGLRRLDIPADMVPTQEDFRSLYRQPTSLACFSSSAKHEIRVNGKKLVGSAQRRMAGGVLQHGSILMGMYHRRLPEFLTIGPEEKQRLGEMLEQRTIAIGQIRPIDTDTLKGALKNAFAKTFDIQFLEESHAAPGPEHVPV